MTDEDIEIQRIAGDISLVLEHGTKEEKQSLGRVIRYLNPQSFMEILDCYGIELEND